MPGSLRSRCSTGALVVALGLLALATLVPESPARAQQQGGAEAEAAAEKPAKPPRKPETIPIAEIAVRSEKTKSGFAEIAQKLAPAKAASDVEQQLPDLERRVAGETRQARKLVEGIPTAATLDETLLALEGFKGELDALQAALRSRSEEIESQIEGIRKVQELWKATREATSEDAPDAVVKSIDEVEAEAARVTKLAKARQGAIVTLQSRVAQLSETARSTRSELEEFQQQQVRSVLERDRPPIWSPGALDVVGESIATRFSEVQAKDVELVRSWIGDQSNRVWLHVGLFVVLALLLRAARTRVRSRAETDETLAGIEAVFRHPVALALLLVLLTAYWSFTAMPRPVFVLLGATLVVPAFVVLRRLLDSSLFPILNALAFLWTVDRVRILISPIHGAPRLLLIFEMLFVAGLMLWWMRPARLAAIPMEVASARSFRLTAAAVRLALGVSLLSIVAEAAGFGTLAELSGGALLLAAFAGMVLYGAVRALDGITAVLLQLRPLRLLGMVQRHRGLLRRRIGTLVGLGALVWWSYVVLDLLGLALPLAAGARAVLSAELSFGELAISLGDLAAFFFTIWLTFQISRFLRFVLEEDVYPRAPLKKGQPYAVSTLLHYVILTVGFVVALLALGFDMSRFTLLAGAFGVGIGFGLQTIVNNFVSGLILLTERPIEVGDTVSIESGNVFGEVKRIGIRSSTVRTWQGAEVIVPNADLIAQSVINWTHSDRRRRMEIPVGVAYGTDPQRVIEILKEAARSQEPVLEDPAPYVLFLGFGDSSLDFEVRAWTDEFDDFQSVRSGVCVAINAGLEQAGITIPFPQRDLHIKTPAEERSAEQEPAQESPGVPPVEIARR